MVNIYCVVAFAIVKELRKAEFYVLFLQSITDFLFGTVSKLTFDTLALIQNNNIVCTLKILLEFFDPNLQTLVSKMKFCSTFFIQFLQYHFLQYLLSGFEMRIYCVIRRLTVFLFRKKTKISPKKTKMSSRHCAKIVPGQNSPKLQNISRQDSPDKIVPYKILKKIVNINYKKISKQNLHKELSFLMYCF